MQLDEKKIDEKDKESGRLIGKNAPEGIKKALQENNCAHEIEIQHINGLISLKSSIEDSETLCDEILNALCKNIKSIQIHEDAKKSYKVSSSRIPQQGLC